MQKRNLLIVPECDQFIMHYREEIAHEFGIQRSVLENDIVSREMTKRVIDEVKKEVKKEAGDNKNEKET